MGRYAESASVASVRGNAAAGAGAGAAVASYADVLSVICFFAWARVVLYSQTAFDVVIYNNCLAVLVAAVVSVVAVALFPKSELLAGRGSVIAVSACAVVAGIAIALSADEAVHVAAVCVQQVCIALLLAPLALVVCRGSRRRLVCSVVIGIVFSLACMLMCRVQPGAIRLMTIALPLVTGLLLCVSLDAARRSGADGEGATGAGRTAVAGEGDGRAAVAAGAGVGAGAGGRAVAGTGDIVTAAGGAEGSQALASGSQIAGFARAIDPHVLAVSACAIIAQFFYGAVFQPYVINASAITYGACIAGIVMAAAIGALLMKYGSAAQSVAALSMLLITVVSLTFFALGIFESPIVSIAIVGAVSCCLSMFGWLFAYDFVADGGRAAVPTFVFFHFVVGGSLGMYCGIVFHGVTGSDYGMMAMVAIVGIALFTLLYIVMDRMHMQDSAADREAAGAGAGAGSVDSSSVAGAAGTAGIAGAADTAGIAGAAGAAGIAGAVTTGTNLGGADRGDDADAAVGGVDEASGQTPSERPDDVLQGIYGQRMADLDFTDREMEVCIKLFQGMSIRAVAEELQCSDNTVKYHLRNIYHKCDVHSRDELRAFLQAP